MMTETRRYTIDQIMTGVDLDPVEAPRPVHTPEPREEQDLARAGDAAVAQLDPGDVLERHGWSFGHEDGDGNRYYARPGKEPSEGISTTVFADGQVFNHSTTATALTGIPHGPSRVAEGKPGSVDVFGLVAHMEHGGDFSAAKRALNAAGYGEAAEVVDFLPWVEQAQRRAAERAGEVAEEGPADEPRSVAELVRSRILHGDGILAVQPKAPLVADWLDVGDMAAMFGPPGAGKSFMSIDLAACVALGREWHGHGVHQGPVLYIIAEGAQGVPGRWAAWKAHNDHQGDIPGIHWLPMRINLRDREWSRGVAEAALDLQPVLIIVDTLARTFSGGNENASEHMGEYIAGVDDLRELTGATVLIIHHSGKDVSAGGRGHSSLLGALDAELALKRTGRRMFTVESTKQKDKEEKAATAFRLVPAAESVAVELDDTPEAATMADITKLIEVLEALREVAGYDGVGTRVWRDAAFDRGAAGSESTFYRAKRELESRGGIRNAGSGATPRWLPVMSVLNDPSLLLEAGQDEQEIEAAPGVD